MSFQKDSGCFVCGPENPLGMQAPMVSDPRSRSASCRMAIPARFQGWQGVVHGGITSALLDETGIYACRTCGETFVTAELSVRYRRPVPVGEVVEITARVVARRRQIFQVESRLTIGGEVFAEGQAKVFCLDSPGGATGL